MPLVSDSTLTTWRNNLAEGHTETWLKTAIVLWALGVTIVAVFIVHNKWLLAGILLWEILP
jgi:hypothetical protein